MVKKSYIHSQKNHKQPSTLDPTRPAHIGCLWLMAQMYKHFLNQQIKNEKKWQKTQNLLTDLYGRNTWMD